MTRPSFYLSGFTGRIPGTNTVVPGGIQAETKQVMEIECLATMR